MHVNRSTGIQAALASAFLMGLAPVFGRQAILSGFSPLLVVALRTGLAAGFLLLIAVLFRRKFLVIYPVGFLGCMLAGMVNGLGSIFYYMALARLSASLGQMLYALYPFFLALWLLLDHHPPNRLTTLRMILATTAVFLLTGGAAGGVDFTGVLLMLASGMLYAMHIPINQRVLYDVPSPTVTLYTLLAMSAVVIPAYLILDASSPARTGSWTAVLSLTLVTIFSRLALFAGVKHLGSMETALLGLGELLIAVTFGHLWLKETLTMIQWLGAITLTISLLMVIFEKPASPRPKRTSSWLNWIQP